MYFVERFVMPSSLGKVHAPVGGSTVLLTVLDCPPKEMTMHLRNNWRKWQLQGKQNKWRL